ncbi:hypothetical protein [Ralstonia chuxiongensis]|uniref:Uncharacterized protein n=1 Tax=Ralstonia chuxiongensis TaxID=2957504 RepID=A0AA42BK30_9RALS|nr:hypothetical protein [Ralstonia chuxiongensis]MCP1175859.1 hypothetical protein [Ralstonia chuxiongensis]
MDKQKYPETDGRGPFWELLRYLLRGMTFGPVVCAKLVADFDAWDPDIRSRSDDEFYEFYCKMREYFSCGTEKDALVTYPSWWSDREGNIILEPKLGAEPGVLPGNCR